MTSNAFWAQHFHLPTGPVLLSVPHAGRVYDPAILTGLRVPFAMTLPLEDRYADTLAAHVIAASVPVIVAKTPRLIIDLNRAPDDFDPESFVGGSGRSAPASTKARAGLGVIPTRLANVGRLWRDALDPADIARRVATVHAPYHAAVAGAMTAARQQFGSALLIDLHSMPPLKGPDAAQIIIGDRFGRSATTAITATAEAVLKGLGFRVAINVPYAGGYVTGRHAAPAAGRHALQIEVDRQLYLDAALDKPGAGLARMQKAMLILVESLRDELTGTLAAAAE